MKKIRFLWNNLFDDAVVSASSEESEFPVSNVKHRWHTRHWRSTDVSSEWVKWDLGSVKDIKAFVLKYHNFTSGATLKIQANSSDSWGSPPLDESLTYNAGHLVKFWDSAQSYRWWRVTIADAGNSDGYLRVGRIFCGDYFSPQYNFTNAYRKRLVDPSVKMYSAGGQISVSAKTHYRTWVYNFELIKTPDNQTFESIFDEVGQSLPYFICQDADDALDTLYYVQNLTDWDIQHISMDTWFSLTIEVEEMR